MHYDEPLTMTITNTQNGVIISDFIVAVATARTVRYTATTTLVPACYDAEAGATLRLNKAHFPPSIPLSRSLEIPSPLFLDAALSTDSFSSSTRRLAPHLFRFHQFHSHHYYQRARVMAFPSLSPPTNSIVQPRFNIYAGPHAGCRSKGFMNAETD